MVHQARNINKWPWYLIIIKLGFSINILNVWSVQRTKRVYRWPWPNQIYGHRRLLYTLYFCTLFKGIYSLTESKNPFISKSIYLIKVFLLFRSISCQIDHAPNLTYSYLTPSASGCVSHRSYWKLMKQLKNNKAICCNFYKWARNS